MSSSLLFLAVVMLFDVVGVLGVIDVGGVDGVGIGAAAAAAVSFRTV